MWELGPSPRAADVLNAGCLQSLLGVSLLLTCEEPPPCVLDSGFGRMVICSHVSPAVALSFSLLSSDGVDGLSLPCGSQLCVLTCSCGGQSQCPVSAWVTSCFMFWCQVSLAGSRGRAACLCCPQRIGYRCRWPRCYVGSGHLT